MNNIITIIAIFTMFMTWGGLTSITRSFRKLRRNILDADKKYRRYFLLSNMSYTVSVFLLIPTVKLYYACQLAYGTVDIMLFLLLMLVVYGICMIIITPDMEESIHLNDIVDRYGINRQKMLSQYTRSKNKWILKVLLISFIMELFSTISLLINIWK